MLAAILKEANHLLDELLEFERELQVILPYAESRWSDHPRHFPYTSYGFVMIVFSKVDQFGQYWFPKETRQHSRMISFLTSYLGYPEKESDLAIHLWRHNLMHTSEMRPLRDTRDGNSYQWLFHYKLGSEHMRLNRTSRGQILSLGLLNLVEDLRRGLEKAIGELPRNAGVIKEWPLVTARLGEFPRR